MALSRTSRGSPRATRPVVLGDNRSLRQAARRHCDLVAVAVAGLLSYASLPINLLPNVNIPW